MAILQKGRDFIDDDLDLDQQPVVTSPYGDRIFPPVDGEACECERAVGPDIVTLPLKRLDDPAPKCPSSVWSQLRD